MTTPDKVVEMSTWMYNLTTRCYNQISDVFFFRNVIIAVSFIPFMSALQSWICFLLQRMSKRTLEYHSKSAFSSVGLYILSAVRTPIGLLNGTLSEFSAQQLGSFAFKEALQRALVPGKDVQSLFLNCDLHNTKEIINRSGLSKTMKVTSVSVFGMENFLEAIKFLLMDNQAVCMAGGMDSSSNVASIVNQEYLKNIKSIQENNLLKPNTLMKYAEQDYKNFLVSHKSGAFSDEIIKIHFIKKGQQIVVGEDEIPTLHFSTGENSKLKYLPPFGDGAAAIVISTESFIRSNHLSPLAKVISFSQESAKGNDIASAQCLAIEKALKMANCQCNEIRRWEIDSVIGVAFNCISNHFKIDSSLVNRDGGAFNLGQSIGLSGMKALCHLTHSLRDGELGCAVACDFSRNISVLIIQKLSSSSSTSSEKPQLTLYTKHICPLCDELKEGLKPFEGRFSLKEIDIEADENKNYNDLFKYEIPVLFLEGRFLCKNKLDADLLNRRLAAHENAP